jgi:hypothetical protein
MHWYIGHVRCILTRNNFCGITIHINPPKKSVKSVKSVAKITVTFSRKSTNHDARQYSIIAILKAH